MSLIVVLRGTMDKIENLRTSIQGVRQAKHRVRDRIQPQDAFNLRFTAAYDWIRSRTAFPQLFFLYVFTSSIGLYNKLNKNMNE